MEKIQLILPLEDIIPYEKNARKNDDAVPVVMESIRQCEYIAPIIVDEDNVILAGHTRWKALKKLVNEDKKYSKIDVIKVTGLTEEQKKKYRLLDNKTNEIAQWDFELLPDELEGLDFGDLGYLFDIETSLEKERENIEIEENNYEIIIECQNEEEQQNLYNELQERNIKCRISTL